MTGILSPAEMNIYFRHHIYPIANRVAVLGRGTGGVRIDLKFCSIALAWLTDLENAAITL